MFFLVFLLNKQTIRIRSHVHLEKTKGKIKLGKTNLINELTLLK